MLSWRRKFKLLSRPSSFTLWFISWTCFLPVPTHTHSAYRWPKQTAHTCLRCTVHISKASMSLPSFLCVQCSPAPAFPSWKTSSNECEDILPTPSTPFRVLVQTSQSSYLASYFLPTSLTPVEHTDHYLQLHQIARASDLIVRPNSIRWMNGKKVKGDDSNC